MDRTLVLRFDARILVLVGALLVSVAVSLPWANLPSFLAGDLARQGIDGGGLLTLGLAVLAAFSLLLPWRPLRRVSLPAAFWAALIDLVALVALIRVIQLSTTLKMSLGAQLSSVGSGLYLTFAGVLLMLIGGLAGVTSPVSFAPSDQISPWLSYVGWGALIAMLLSSCLCAWGIGWLARPDTLGRPGQAKASPTFAPASTTYLATPLVDVYLMPLGTALRATTTALSPTLTHPVTALPTVQTLLTASPTPRRTPAGAPTGPPTPTLPIISASTFTPTPKPTPLTSPLATPTVTIPVAVTPTTTVSATPTPTATVSATLTPTGIVSATPTLTATITVTLTVTPTR